jgi:hypothetical protein
LDLASGLCNYSLLSTTATDYPSLGGVCSPAPSSTDDATKVGGQANTEVRDKHLEGCRAVGTGNVEECQGSGSDSSSRFQSERDHHEARGHIAVPLILAMLGDD